MFESKMEAIDNFEEFLFSDLPSKIFPEHEIKGESFYRTDAFKTKKEVEEYIEGHFKVFRKELAKGVKTE